jgi:hypothetical protein
MDMKNCTPLPNLTAQDIERFWSLVDKKGESECWIWKGQVSGTGYGLLIRYGKHCAAHRISLKLSVGKEFAPLWALHHCDVKLCCNPSHLYTGTAQLNAEDRVARGLSAGGGDGRRHLELDEATVLEIRSLYASGSYTYTSLAQQFKVHKGTIWEYVSGRKILKYTHTPT